MNIENLIYIYITVCILMICFNCAVIFLNFREEKTQQPHRQKIEQEIRRQLQLLEAGQPVEQRHLHWLRWKLHRASGLLALNEVFASLRQLAPQRMPQYIDEVFSVFVELAAHYSRRDPMEATCFVWFVRQNSLLACAQGHRLHRPILNFVCSANLYCRENALYALYELGDPDLVLDALRLLDQNTVYHDTKFIHDGLLRFAGDRELLLQKLWAQIERFSAPMQAALINYMRLSSARCEPQILEFLLRSGQNDEVRFACIRYFGRFYYEAAYPVLLDAAASAAKQPAGVPNGSPLPHTAAGPLFDRWEYAAIAATALQNYPSRRTTELLTALLYSANWYIRTNAAASLVALGVSYLDLADVFDGNDRYAREALQYCFDCRTTKEEERTASPDRKEVANAV